MMSMGELEYVSVSEPNPDQPGKSRLTTREYVRVPSKERLSKNRQIHGLADELKRVYFCIANSKAEGIWSKAVKNEIRIPGKTITKHIKQLVKLNLVKSFKTIKSKQKSVYCTWDITPSREHTGGPWYTSNRFDALFVNQCKLRGKCFVLLCIPCTGNNI